MRELESAGCKAGLLKLIVLTHGDFDHTGNVAYLRNAFGGKMAMHYDDLGMVQRGDMFVNRNKPKPVLNSLTDDLAAANASIQRLGSMRIGTVYPGHGRPFPMHLVRKGST